MYTYISLFYMEVYMYVDKYIYRQIEIQRYFPAAQTLGWSLWAGVSLGRFPAEGRRGIPARGKPFDHVGPTCPVLHCQPGGDERHNHAQTPVTAPPH